MKSVYLQCCLYFVLNSGVSLVNPMLCYESPTSIYYKKNILMYLYRGGTTGAVQLKQLATDYSQQKHTTWADNYCSIKG